MPRKPATAIRDEIEHFRRGRIRGEAERLFYERGFSNTSMDAIAESVQATKPFIYGSYASKADILVDIHLRVVESVWRAIDEARREGGRARDNLASFARRLTRLVLDHQAAVAVYFREESALPARQLKKVNDLKGRIDEAIADLLQQGTASGDFRVDDPHTAALAIGGMISWSYTWYRDGGRLDAAALADRMAQYALRIAGARA